MSMTGPNRSQMREAIDRHGGDLSRWPDGSLADAVHAALLSDRPLRRYRDEAVAVERRLGAVRLVLDEEILRSGAAERTARAVLARLPARRWRPSWVAVAAALVIAAGLGSVFDLSFLTPVTDTPMEVVVLDPLVFGPTEAEMR
jgi:hypothetical protein